MPVPFHVRTQGFSGPEGQPLPTLNLSRLFVLTSPNTCSASEAIINGLRGVGVQVVQIGTTTCGKPYGFYPEGQLRHDVFLDPVPGRERPGVRRLSGRLLAGKYGQQPGNRAPRAARSPMTSAMPSAIPPRAAWWPRWPIAWMAAAPLPRPAPRRRAGTATCRRPTAWRTSRRGVEPDPPATVRPRS